MANIWIIVTTNSLLKTVDEISDEYKVALVLGTSKRLVGGEENPYFNFRIEAVTHLYKSGKVNHILLSGDNRTKFYNEPLDMKNALLNNGIPESSITMDHAGLRTLDSVVRCYSVFGHTNFIVVTQKFHAHRALFISNYYGLDVIGYVAESPPLNFSWKIKFREMLARPLAIFDLYVLENELTVKQAQ